MPFIYGGSAGSHSTVFTEFHSSGLPTSSGEQNLPPLTTIYTPPSTCRDRWMFWYSRGPIARSQYDYSDRLYISCQPYSIGPSNSAGLLNSLGVPYSPGVCTDGQTLAEITEHQVSGTAGLMRYWQASCCKSGMTIGTDYDVRCVSTLSTPLRVFSMFPIFYEDGTTRTTRTDRVFETVFSHAQTDVNGDVYTSGRTVAMYTTLTSGLAIADPLTVAWQIEDLSYFPSAYASSLAQRLAESTASAETSSSIPSNLSSGNDIPHHLNLGAIAGIVVGSILGAVLIGAIAIILLVRRRRRKSNILTAGLGVPELQEQETLATRKRLLGGRWRSKAETQKDQPELDPQSERMLSQHPIELDALQER